LAPRTVLVHKSTVATFTKLSHKDSLSSHPLVKKILKAIMLKSPPIHNPTTWDVGHLVSWIKQRKLNESNLYQVSQHVATLLLLASGRRIHDLTLLHTDTDHCNMTDQQVTFWPVFGSKTDAASCRQSGWCLLKCDDDKLNLCYWIPLLIEISRLRRNKADTIISSLFISTRGKV
jgi:hypothetical protein